MSAAAAIAVHDPREESRLVLARMIAFLGYPAEWLDAIEQQEARAGRVWRERDGASRTMRD